MADELHLAPVVPFVYPDILALFLELSPMALTPVLPLIAIMEVWRPPAFILYQPPVLSVAIVVHRPLVQSIFGLFVSLPCLLLPTLFELPSVVLYLVKSLQALFITPKFHRGFRDTGLRALLLVFGLFITVILALRPVPRWAL